MARVLIADDSTVIRARVASWIEEEPGLDLVGQAENGLRCLELFGRLQPDVVVLDVEMPDLDGLATLRRIRAADPQVPVIMFSALTESGSRTTVAAMLAGATDCVPKPRSLSDEQETRRTLVSRIRCLTDLDPPPATNRQETIVDRLEEPHARESPDLIAVASSTGGPGALGEFLTALGHIRQPVVIVQHMQAGFLSLLVDQLAHILAADVAIGRHGEVLGPEVIRFAPEGVHLQVHPHPRGFRLGHWNGPMVNSCRPAADVLFASVAASAHRPVAVVLSGMGIDGLAGAQRIVASGGIVAAQDRATSAVWGMPGAIVGIGIARLVGSPTRLGGRVRMLAEPQRRVSV